VRTLPCNLLIRMLPPPHTTPPCQIHFGDYKAEYATQQYGTKGECGGGGVGGFAEACALNHRHSLARRLKDMQVCGAST